MRVDRDPFRDPRVRRAVALTLNRPDLIKRVLLGSGTLGNDSPFWSKFPSTDPSIKQRKQNLAARARRCSRRPGRRTSSSRSRPGTAIDLPDYAQAIQAAGRQAGMDI